MALLNKKSFPKVTAEVFQILVSPAANKNSYQTNDWVDVCMHVLYACMYARTYGCASTIYTYFGICLKLKLVSTVYIYTCNCKALNVCKTKVFIHPCLPL